MTQQIELVIVAPEASPRRPCAIDIASMTEAEFMAFVLNQYQDKCDPWRLTDAQMQEIEDERIGAEMIAPYIAF